MCVFNTPLPRYRYLPLVPEAQRHHEGPEITQIITILNNSFSLCNTNFIAKLIRATITKSWKLNIKNSWLFMVLRVAARLNILCSALILIIITTIIHLIYTDAKCFT